MIKVLQANLTFSPKAPSTVQHIVKHWDRGEYLKEHIIWSTSKKWQKFSYLLFVSLVKSNSVCNSFNNSFSSSSSSFFREEGGSFINFLVSLGVWFKELSRILSIVLVMTIFSVSADCEVLDERLEPVDDDGLELALQKKFQRRI